MTEAIEPSSQPQLGVATAASAPPALDSAVDEDALDGRPLDLICPRCDRRGSRLGDACTEHRLFLVPTDAAASAPTNSLLGEMVAERYVILGVVGSGAVGTVYWGVQYPIGRRVAVKVLHAGITAGQEDQERFLREARAIASLNHPHVVTCYDYGFTHDNMAYMALEFLRGASLEAVMAEGPLDLSQIAYIARQLLEGVAAMHDAELIHRDLKPANMMLCQVGRNAAFLKIIDFGLVRGRGGEDQQRITQAGHILGTPVYMAPEQALGKRDITPSTDVYALGCILYEMIAGRPPFDGRNVMDILLSHVQKPPPPFEGPRARLVPPALKEFVLRCLEKEPEDRFKTGVDALRAFQRLGLSEASPDALLRLQSLLMIQASTTSTSAPPSTRLLAPARASLRLEVTEEFLRQRRAPANTAPIEADEGGDDNVGLARQWGDLLWTTVRTTARLLWSIVAAIPVWGWLRAVGMAQSERAFAWIEHNLKALSGPARRLLIAWPLTAVPLGVVAAMIAAVVRAIVFVARAIKAGLQRVLAAARRADPATPDGAPMGLPRASLVGLRGLGRRIGRTSKGIVAVHDALGRKLVLDIDAAVGPGRGRGPWRRMRARIAPFAGRLLLVGNVALVLVPLLSALAWLL